jgi:TetR/AcrR family transcriptional regulator, ethionamide resistance regulator
MSPTRHSTLRFGAMTVAAQRTRRRQQREETRAQILHAAQELLQERSFRELSVDALMSRAGHTRTVFYRHFDDVPSMVLALIAEVGAELVVLGEEWERVEHTSPDEARARLALFVDFHVRNGRLIRAVVEAAHHDELVQEAYEAMFEGFVGLTARAIRQRIDSGDVEPIDADEVARALIWMLTGYLIDRLGGDEPSDPQRVLETVWTIWTRTLFPSAPAASSA